jgi:hypothetical protein
MTTLRHWFLFACACWLVGVGLLVNACWWTP